MTEPSWRLLEAFIQIANAGSLTRGARALGISQPTASRYLAQLEAALSTSLFVRHSRGLALTDRGAELLSAAQGVDERIHEVFRHAAGLSERVRGSVRISANEPIGVEVLPPCLAQLRTEHPELQIDLVIDNTVANLSRREADIAVRMFRPKQLDLVARRVGTLEVGLYASRDYVARRGAPHTMAESEAHTLIGFDRDPSWLSTLDLLGMKPSAFAFRTDSVLAQMQAIVDGVGIGGMQVSLAARRANVVQVLEELRMPPLELWVVMHADLRRSAAARVAFDALTDWLTRYANGSASPAG